MKNEITIYLCDDNQNFIEEITQRTYSLIGSSRTLNIKAFNDGRALLTQWNEEFADVVFLDIDMPTITGFEVAEELQKSKRDTVIIFITSHEDKVYQSWEFHPFWFVRKNHMHDLRVVIPKLLRKIDSEEERQRLTFNLKAENKTIEIDINTVIYIESYKNDIIILDRVFGKKQIRCKIADAEKQLYPLNFIRIQNGFLVNCRYISKITSREVILTEGTHLGLSRSKIDYARKEYQNFIRRTLI